MTGEGYINGVKYYTLNDKPKNGKIASQSNSEWLPQYYVISAKEVQKCSKPYSDTAVYTLKKNIKKAEIYDSNENGYGGLEKNSPIYIPAGENEDDQYEGWDERKYVTQKDDHGAIIITGEKLSGQDGRTYYQVVHMVTDSDSSDMDYMFYIPKEELQNDFNPGGVAQLDYGIYLTTQDIQNGTFRTSPNGKSTIYLPSKIYG